MPDSYDRGMMKRTAPRVGRPEKRIPSTEGPDIDTRVTSTTWSPRDIALSTRGPLSTPANLGRDIRRDWAGLPGKPIRTGRSNKSARSRR